MELTLQSAFDTAVLAMRAQGGPSRTVDGICQYRVASGRRCAIGALIPDEFYAPWMDNPFSCGGRISAVLRAYAAINGNYPKIFQFMSANIGFFLQLQACHDMAVPASCSTLSDAEIDVMWLARFLDRARHLAAAYKLDATSTYTKEPTP